MSYTLPDINYQNFGGIREHNGVNANGSISALEATNVELYRYGIGANTGVRSVLGNALYIAIGLEYKIIEHWQTIQNGTKYLIVYAENATNGTLFNVAMVNGVLTALTLKNNLSKTGEANGISISANTIDIYDRFIFSNGDSFVSVRFDENGNSAVQNINAIDFEGRTIKGLAMCEYNGSLVVASKGIGISASKQGDVFTWNANAVDSSGASLSTNSWYVGFSKEVTAIVPYANDLICFNDGDSTAISGTPVNLSTFTKKSAGLGGCASYSSWVIHDKYLFFYDYHQKNLYYYMQDPDTGKTLLGDPIATEIQSYLSAEFNRCKLYSCITGTRNEIWMIINNSILVFDYYNKEWCERKEPTTVNCIGLYKDALISGDNTGNLYIEHINRNFNGTYVGSSYETQLINMGSSSNLKKQRTPICIGLDKSYNNNFYIELTVDNKKMSPVHITSNSSGLTGVFGDDTETLTGNNTFDIALFASENRYEQNTVNITLRTWYTAKIRFFTQSEAEDFAVQSIEFKNMRMKTRTLGI